MKRTRPTGATSRESGQLLPMFGLILSVLIAFLAMGVDLGQGYMQRRANQDAADAAAVAAQNAYVAGASDANIQSAILSTLQADGFASSSVVFLSAGSSSAGTDVTKVYVDAKYGAYSSTSNSCVALTSSSYVGSYVTSPPSGANCVMVKVTTAKKTFFAAIPVLGFAQVGASAKGSASWVTVPDSSSAAAAVTAATISAGTVTLTIPAQATAPAVGSTAMITGASPAGWDITGTVTSSSTTSVTFTTSSSPGTYSGNGTVTFMTGPVATPVPTQASYASGTGEGYAMWGGQRADNRMLNIGDTVAFFADSGWNSSNDVQTTCSGTCEYHATNNYKGLADSQCFQLPLTATCTAPNGAHGNPAASLTAGSKISVVVVSAITASGSVNVLQRIGIANLTVVTCPSSPTYLTSGTNVVCGTITGVDAGTLNENIAMPVQTTTVPVIGNSN